MNGVCRHLKLAFVFGDNPMLAHQTGYPVSTTGMTAFIQLGMDSRTAIGRATPLMNSFDFPSITAGFPGCVGFQDGSARHRTHYYPLPESDTSNQLEMLLGDPV